jgi:transcription antitermination factor NusG
MGENQEGQCVMREDGMGLAWYAIRTTPNRESVAASHLRTWIEDVYMPVCERPTMLDITKPDPTDRDKVRRICVDTQRVRTGPILRGYIFVRLEMSERAASEIALTHGVLCLVPDNWKPEPISDDDFKTLKMGCDALASAGETDADYSHMIGKTWRVKGGTYAGYQGQCDSIVKDFAVLKLGMFKSEVPVPVLIADIDDEPLSEQEQVVKCAMLGYKRPRKHAY